MTRESLPPIAFRNDSGESIPPYAAMRVTGHVQDETTANEVYLTADKPNAEAGQAICFNGRTTVEDGKDGYCTFEPVCYANVATAGVNGDQYGTVDGEWQLDADAAGGFTILAAVSDGPNGEDIALINRLGGSGCPDRNEIHQITLIGSPTSGTFDLEYTVTDVDGNDVTETLTFNYDDTAAEVKTELVTHSQIGSDDVTVTAGPFPDATVQIEFVEELAATAVALPTAAWGPLVGTGVAVIISRPQSGYPN